MNPEAIVHLFHIIIVGGLFLYVGIYKTNIPKTMFPVLRLVIWVVIMIIALDFK